MSLLRQISVHARMLACMAIAAGALCAVAGWGLWDTRLAQQKADALFAYSESAHSAMTGLRESVATMLHVQTQIVALGSSNVVETERLIDLWNGEVARVLESSRRIAANAGDDAQVQTLVDTQHKLVQTYTQAVDPVLKQLKGATMEPQVALAFIGQAAPTLDELKKAVVDLDKLQAQRLDERKAEAVASAQVMAAWRLAVVVGALALFVPFMWLTRQSICQPLDVATALACRIAQGDLTGTIRAEGKDEPARLLHALGEMQDSLRRIVGDVRDGADNIQVASHEVAQGNADLSNRTEQTASNLQQAAGSMSHLTDAVRQSAESARLANQLATSAAEVARRGGNVVSEVVSTMDEINSSSKKISDIIGVIDGIAFQTNILALNAAVEAARAGEQGRGFAVVASEVRSLAGRSAEAAKEIKSLIGSSVGKVEAGSRLVGEAGETMQEIVASVQRVCDMINAITSTAAEQSDGIGQINATVGQLDQMTQQNSALVEQSAAAAESLKDQAQKLASTVATFRMQPA